MSPELVDIIEGFKEQSTHLASTQILYELRGVPVMQPPGASWPGERQQLSVAL